MKTYAVYILKCSDGTYYTGVTNDIDRRLSEHSEVENPKAYIYSRRPFTLVFYQDFEDPNIAIDAEKQLKKWSTLKKEALINGDFDLLPILSKKEF